MQCRNCGTLNEEDAVFCKTCGFNLDINDEVNETNNKKEKHERKKSKTKVKKKVKKVKEKSKKDKKNKQVEKEMSFPQKLLMLFLFLMCIVLFGALLISGYYIWENQSIKVPNVTNLSYEQAELILAKSDLNIKKILKETDEEDLNNIVIKQNRKEGRKVRKNSTIKVTIGEYKEKYYTLINLVGMDIEDAKEELEENNISFTINYKEDKKKENIILSQSIKPNTKLKKGDNLELIVSKKIEKDEDEIKDEDTNSDIKENDEEEIDDNEEIDNNDIKEGE